MPNKERSESPYDEFSPFELNAFTFLDYVHKEVRHGTGRGTSITPVLALFRTAFPELDEGMSRRTVLKWYETYPARHPEERLSDEV